MAHGKVKLSVMVDVKTADEIDRVSKAWNMSLSDTLRFIVEYYLKFGIKNTSERIKIMTKKPDKNIIKELTNRLVDSRILVKILKVANAEKDLLINK